MSFIIELFIGNVLSMLQLRPYVVDVSGRLDGRVDLRWVASTRLMRYEI